VGVVVWAGMGVLAVLPGQQGKGAALLVIGMGAEAVGTPGSRSLPTCWCPCAWCPWSEPWW
jgi:predicted N-acetyltransferase YhbS